MPPLFSTIAVLLWSGYHLFRNQDDALADRLEELQSRAVVISRQIVTRRKGGKGFFNRFLYPVSLAPGGEGWLRRTERELAQAGIRNKQALGAYVLGHVLFMGAILLGMLWLQRDNDMQQRFVAMVAAFIIGWLIPPQVLHRLVKRYRRKLQDALPDTVDMLGIVLGTGLAATCNESNPAAVFDFDGQSSLSNVEEWLSIAKQELPPNGRGIAGHVARSSCNLVWSDLGFN